MIATVSPMFYCVEQTLNTLRYATRYKNNKNYRIKKYKGQGNNKGKII